MAFASPASPGTSIVDACVSNGNGTSEPITTNNRDRPVVAQPVGEEDHGRDADSSSEQQRPASAGHRFERPSDGSDDAQSRAGALRGEESRAVAYLLVQDVGPAVGRVGPHQGHRTAHREQRVAAHVHESPRRRTGGDPRRVDAQPPLAGRMRLVRQNLAFLDEDGAAMHLKSVPAGGRARVAHACGPRVYYSGLPGIC